ncbi:MAG: T9SS type A sorting domain-containing protein [Bacteroidota bacterium]|nr:T9SS type A sorting domain-containing protein [Bacteroidota bacterium]
MKKDGFATLNNQFSWAFEKEPGTVFFDKNKEIVLKNASISVGISEEINNRLAYRLEQNIPNPANGHCLIRFALPHAAQVSIDLYNLNGKKLMNILNESLEQGEHQVDVELSGLAEGTYYYSLRTGDFVSTKKLVVGR